MDNYLDFGSSSDSDNEDGGMALELDSDEEERQENNRLLKMFELHNPPSKIQRNIQDFEAEMEAELDRRAFEVESQGGMEHQKSLSRSSSTTSLNKSPRASPVPGSFSGVKNAKKSNLKRAHSSSDSKSGGAKSVKFALPAGEVAASVSGSPPENGVVEGTEMKGSEQKALEMYNELYFDSDESDGEDGEGKKRKESKRRFMTDDELFYDPSSDANDQAWIDNQRRKSYGQKKGTLDGGDVNLEPGKKLSSVEPTTTQSISTSSGSETNISNNSRVPLPSTDAILNCPACFTTVCHDCQRHDLYVGQYRAMFVMNCVINRQETLRIPEKAPKKYRKRAIGGSNGAEFFSSCSSDAFHPVMCKVCKTQVAMYDVDEVYHFFNVLASQP